MLDEETCTVSVTHLILWTGFEPLLIEDECQKWPEFVGSSGSNLHYFGFRSESGAQRGERGQCPQPCSESSSVLPCGELAVLRLLLEPLLKVAPSM